MLELKYWKTLIKFCYDKRQLRSKEEGKYFDHNNQDEVERQSVEQVTMRGKCLLPMTSKLSKTISRRVVNQNKSPILASLYLLYEHRVASFCCVVCVVVPVSLVTRNKQTENSITVDGHSCLVCPKMQDEILKAHFKLQRSRTAGLGGSPNTPALKVSHVREEK